MTSCRSLMVLFLLAALAIPARAQEPLTVEQAVDAAIAQNPSLRAARAAAGEAAAHADAARAVFFPKVSLSESWQRGNDPVFAFGALLSSRTFTANNFAVDSLNHPDATAMFRASVAVEQIVFDPGRRAAAHAATARRELADAATTEAELALLVATTETFGRVLSNQAAAQAARAARDAGREDLARAEHRRDAGLATDADVLALIVHVADVDRRLIQAEGDADVARAELNRLMGAPIDRTFRVVPPTIAPQAATIELASLVAQAETARPELQRAAAAERVAELAARQARAAFLPTVAAQAALDATGVSFDSRASGWIVGAAVRWSLSVGGAERAESRAAASGLARARALRDEARAAVHVEVIAAVRRLAAAEARQAAGRAAVEQAREAERIVRDRYEAGMASVADVLRAATAVLDAEANRRSALVDAIVGRALLNRAVGRRSL